MSVPLRAQSKVPNQEVSVKRRWHGSGNAGASAKEVEAVRGTALGTVAINGGHLRSSGHEDAEDDAEACGYGQTDCRRGERERPERSTF